MKRWQYKKKHHLTNKASKKGWKPGPPNIEKLMEIIASGKCVHKDWDTEEDENE